MVIKDAERNEQVLILVPWQETENIDLLNILEVFAV
jgi:hypothetical protein